jgi:L-fuconolactonase
MVTEGDWDTWSEEELSPYIDVVLEAFTPKRLMFGSDWPVVTLASSYQRWIGTVRAAIAQLSSDERDWILAKTAIEAYRLATE